MSEKFNLRWNDFQTNVAKSFGIFRNESYLHDVTLVSDDFKQIPAHKLVLSTTSEYFRNILQQTKQSQPLICLDGVNSEDLKNVLDYVYDGEVKIHKEELNKFLSIAEKLKLEGLLSNGNEDDVENEDKISPEATSDKTTNFDVEPIMVNNHPKKIKKRTRTHPLTETKLITYENRDNFSEEEHKQRLIDNVQVNSDRTASCKICGKLFGGKDAKSNAKIHVEVHIEGLIYTCYLCDKKFRSKSSLSMHRSRKHKNLF